MHVRISHKARRILANRKLAQSLVFAILDNKERLANGETVKVGRVGVSNVRLIK